MSEGDTCHNVASKHQGPPLTWRYRAHDEQADHAPPLEAHTLRPRRERDNHTARRNSGHRRALFANLAAALIKHEQITTTLPKAKDLRPIVEKLVTLGKRGDLHARRQAISQIGSETLVKRLDPGDGTLQIADATERLGLRSPGELDQYAIPKDLANDMTKWLKAWTTPEELSPVISAWHQATNLFKSWVTSPFPGFHTRNIATGLFNMWRDGALSLEAMQDAKNILQGRAMVKPLPGMSGGDYEQVMQQIIKEAVQNRVAFTRGTHQTSDAVRTAMGDLPRMTAELPGKVVQSSEELGGKLAGVAKPLTGLPGEKSIQDILGRLGQDTPNDLATIAGKMGVAPDELARLGVAGEHPLPGILQQFPGIGRIVVQADDR
jgi:hypothetical protein